VFPTGERFAYNNAGYVVLALMAERATGVEFYELVRTLVCEPAGMVDYRVPALGRAARTCCPGLPVHGRPSDERVASPGARHRRRRASTRLLPTSAPSGTLCSPDGSCRRGGSPTWCDRTATGRGVQRYGLGFHLDATGDGVYLEGHDAGVSFASVHQPASSTSYTVISNWSEGAWPIVRLLSDRFGN
jgi:CubicO group peptidase (beta-lactamase class C family)